MGRGKLRSRCSHLRWQVRPLSRSSRRARWTTGCRARRDGRPSMPPRPSPPGSPPRTSMARWATTRAETISSFVERRLLDPSESVTIWNADGVVVFAADPTLIGTQDRRLREPDLARALERDADRDHRRFGPHLRRRRGGRRGRDAGGGGGHPSRRGVVRRPPVDLRVDRRRAPRVPRAGRRRPHLEPRRATDPAGSAGGERPAPGAQEPACRRRRRSSSRRRTRRSCRASSNASPASSPRPRKRSRPRRARSVRWTRGSVPPRNRRRAPRPSWAPARPSAKRPPG